jgi:DNA-binding transcriptional regulator PaaX
MRMYCAHYMKASCYAIPICPMPCYRHAWSGLEARQLCQVLYQDVKAASEAYLIETVQTLEGTLVATPTVIAER